MLEKMIVEIFTKFKMNFYRNIFGRFENREANLTAVETFCVEVIHAMGKPTVNEFARFVSISQPNAAHKIRSLIEKGYVVKSRSSSDKREYSLSVTNKFFQYYDISDAYIGTVTRRIRERLTAEELKALVRFLDIINNELMPEIQLDMPASFN